MTEELKYIGIVDWFHDQSRDANYGFVRHSIIGQHYFNEKLIDKNQDVTKIKTNTIVTFNSKESKHKKGSYEAFNVHLLENEMDLNFLLSEILLSICSQNNGDLDIIKTNLKNRITILFNELDNEKTKESLSYIKTFITEKFIQNDKQLDSKNIIELITFLVKIDESLSLIIEKLLLESLDKKTVFDLWLDGKVNYLDEEYLLEKFQYLEDDIQVKVLNKIPSEQIKTILLYMIFLENTDSEGIAHLIKLSLKTDNDNCVLLLDTLLSEKKQFFSTDFWRDYDEIRADLLKISQENEVIRKKLLHFNAHFISNELSEKFYSNLEIIKKYYQYIETNLPENIQLLSQVIKDNVNVEFAHSLWLYDILADCQIDYIASSLTIIDESEKEKIFTKCNIEEKSNILFKVLLNIDLENNIPEYSVIKELLSITFQFAKELKEKIILEVVNNVPEYFKLNLWLDEFYDELDFNLYKPYVITLSSYEQRLFVKKTLKFIHEGKVELGLDDLTSLNLMDYETSKSIQQIDGSKLDYSTSIMLHTLKELSKNDSYIESNIKSKILEIVINQIKDPKDLLEIKGYFDECAGRCRVHKNEKSNDKGETIVELTYERKNDDQPRMHIYCDGRKSLKVDKITPELHEITKKEFWWCANSPCHEISRQLHSSEDWRNYSLMDFLHILNIEFRDIDLELYLNVINKLNRFLSHMSCRSCNNILRPVGKSNYAFWGVTNFCCTNSECEERNKSKYISHCLNGRCGETIDSRDSRRCSPDGFSSDKCGWYICKNCHSCCSNSSINNRVENSKINNWNYNCHTEGHKDLGLIFCYHCGSKMLNSEGDQIKRKEIVAFFKRNLSNSEIVLGYGQRPKDNGWWFKFAKGKLSNDQYRQKLNNLLLNGFNIPTLNDESLNVQFISEPFNNSKEASFLVCSNSECGIKINLTDDLERARTISQYHTKVFPNVKVK